MSASAEPTIHGAWDLPPPTSPPLFALILASSVGLLALLGAWQLAIGVRIQDVPFTNRRLLETIGIEAALALLWVPVLRRRGWRLRVLTLPLQLRDALRGLALTLAALLAYWLTYAVTAVAAPSFVAGMVDPPTGNPTWGVVLLVSVLNPIAEELLYLGFAANALRREGFAVALVAGTALRFLVHIYQGPAAAVGILPLGLVFTAYYLRTGRLWPVVLAHGILDFVALGRLAAA